MSSSASASSLTSKAITCHVRLRPPGATDGKVDPEAIKMDENTISALNPAGDKRYTFELDKCHGVDSTQENVFGVITPLLEQAYKGINATIFAYGVTGAGKTHTMQGSKTDPGVIPRTVEAVFQRRSQLQPSALSVAFSYVEILKDEVYDLLGDRAMPTKRDVRMSAEGHNIVADLILQPIGSLAEFTKIYEAAAKTRKTASTKLNSSSSRSHAILTLHLELQDDECPGNVRKSKICLTDLAGSENNNLTGNDRERMRESSAINTSLTTLGKVVDALNTNAKRGRESRVFVPYRESKLTRLLQDALGGTSQGFLICCLAPGDKFARDTINTLQFAKKSKNVEDRINVNVDPYENNSRRHSAPSQSFHARSVDPTKSFRIHIGDNPSTKQTLSLIRAGAMSRPTLGAVNLNTRPVRSLADKSGGAKEKVPNGEKENTGLAMTEEQLDQRIQKLINQEMLLAKGKASVEQKPEAKPAPSVIEVPENSASQLNGRPDPSQAELSIDKLDKSIESMTVEERENRARVIVSHARKLHQAGQLAQALELYRKAYVYMPSNRKLAMRITELELSIEGVLPVPHPCPGPCAARGETVSSVPGASDKSTAAAAPASGRGMKRSRAQHGSLAELSGDNKIEIEPRHTSSSMTRMVGEEMQGVMGESPAKRGRVE